MLTAMVEASSSCTSGSRRPSLIVIVDTDLPAGRSGGPMGATELLLSTAYGAGASRRTTSQRIPNGPLPQSFVVLSPQPGTEQLIDIRVDVLRGANSLLHTRATALIPAQGAREVVLFLAAHCLELESQCAASQTCTLRGCEDPAQAVATAVEQPTALDARAWYDATCVSPNGSPCSSEASVPDASVPDASERDGAMDAAAPDATADVVSEPRADAAPDAAIDAGPRDSAADSGDASCNADAMDCVGFVRPLQPQSTSTVHTRRPTFRWTHSASVTPELLLLCADRACTTRRAMIPLPTAADPSGRSAVSTIDLPTTPTFWRVLARRNSDGQVVASPSWFVTANDGAAPRTTSSGTTLDLNADGYADVAIGAPNVTTAGSMAVGRVFVHFGSSTGVAAMAGLTLTGAPGENFGASVASAGDVNGDGFADLIVGAPQATSNGPGRAYLYLGGTSFMPTPRTLSVSAEGGLFGASVASAGDFNGDGYSDVIVSALNAMGGVGRIHLFRGSAAGLEATPQSLSGEPMSNFGVSVAGIGDINADGLSDFAVGANQATGFSGKTFIYLGRAPGLGASADIVLSSSEGGQFGVSVASAGDFNSDGFSDLIVGAHEVMVGGTPVGKAHVFLGRSITDGSISRTPSLSVQGADANGRFGAAVGGGGDFNGDGFSDVIVGAYQAGGSNVGTLSVFTGAATPSSAVRLTLRGAAGVTSFGRFVAVLGDTNGDGFADYAGSTTTGMGGGHLLMLRGGNPLPLATTAVQIAPSGPAVGFGASFASFDPNVGRTRRIFVL
jgi:FG-GAP repeat/FG-GAP-like repeat